MQKTETILMTIKKIWEYNFYKEQEFIRQVVVRHNYATVTSRDIPFAAAPSLASSSAAAATATSPTPDETYASFRPRANAVRLIQLGLTLSDEGGNLPRDPVTGKWCIWEFNVRAANSMDEIDDSFRQELTERGVDVDFNMKHAIHPDVFGIGFWCTDLLMKERIRWIVFSGTAAFSPLLNIMRAEAQLPERREDFLDVVKLYFPKFYEVRQLMAFASLSETLLEVAEKLGLKVQEAEVFNRVGPDSLLTLQVFLGLRKEYFRGEIPEDRANLILDIS